MNREEYQRVGHLFIREPKLVIGSVMKYDWHARYIRQHGGSTFLGHLEESGDLWWVTPSYANGYSFPNIICRCGIGKLDYFQLCVNNYHEEYMRAYTWYKVGFSLARKKGLYVGPLQ